MPPLPELLLYTRPGCSLCDEAREAIGLVVADRLARGLTAPEVVERNIDDDPELHRRLFERIPVLEIGNQRVELVVSVGKVRRLLNEALGDGSGTAAPRAAENGAAAPRADEPAS